MRITRVERIEVDVGFTPRVEPHMQRAIADFSLFQVCKVTTDSGLVGWGETRAMHTWDTDVEMLDSRVVGRRPAELLWDDTLGAGLQQAVFDLAGKALGVPAHCLIGSKVRDWVPLAWWCYDMPPEDWAAEARDAVAAGYTAFKLKPRPWFDVIAQMQALDAATPDHATFDLDFNEFLLSPGDAAPVLRALERFPKVHIFESPIPQRDAAGNRLLRQRIRTPIAMHFDDPAFLTQVNESMCDGFAGHGEGAALAAHTASLAEEASMPLFVQLVGTGLGTAFAAHMAAALPAARWPAVTALNTYAHDLLVRPLRIERGYVRVPGGAGLGVEVDEAGLEQLRRRRTGPKPVRRAIYTIRWADGRLAQYTSVRAYERDFLRGNYPLFEPGVGLTQEQDDGSTAFAERYARVSAAGRVVTNP